MKITVYKGFDAEFLKGLTEEPLLDNDIESKLNVLQFDKKYRKQLDIAVISLEENDSVWITYEEYTLIKNRIDDAINEDGLLLSVCYNNLYPDYYPLSFSLSRELVDEIEKCINSDSTDEGSEECQRFLAIYNTLVNVDEVYYASFYNFEYENEEVEKTKYYAYNADVVAEKEKTDFDIFINEDVDTYLRDLARLKSVNPKVVGVKLTEGLVSKRILDSLKAYSVFADIKLVEYHEILEEDLEMEQALADIAKNDIHIANFQEFRSIRFYKNPDISKETIDVSQAKLIQEIIYQAEKSYENAGGHSFRDIFITASTGAGKSVMFQIPAVYLAKKYGKLTVIIEPVKALMQDQKDKLVSSGYDRVEAFNSDLISQVEKEAVLERVKGGEVDLLYLSPETLLSYSIETIIGDREIGLLIVDEAHIVTTWGMGFRPDYWYLGGYINRLRNQIQTQKGKERKTYQFPVCAFTATAINGGEDDSVSDTIISLYMENPIKYIGYVRRDDISFDIKICETKKLPQSDYEAKKTQSMSKRIFKWLVKNEKTIAYFPYAQNAYDASRGLRAFTGIQCDKKIGVFTGKNVDDLSADMFKEKKRETFEKFRSGKQHIMYATKAFGMGVDIDDVENVYHYAATGTLCDYVQEIGRAARKAGMQGKAITDFYYNDLTFMNKLFGMSQIKQYQIMKVLEGIYDTYKSKKGARNFLISPQSFTYIFNGKNEGECVNKLKTCLLMLEKDFYDKYNFKVIISRPQSVFTKAYVVINKKYEKQVLESEYGKCFKYVTQGRNQEKQPNGALLSDTGDIYVVDLKQIWEDYYPNISFPQFKYWYFNNGSKAKDSVPIMPSIREYFSPRQKVNIEARGDLILSEIRDKIMDDFEYIADTLYSSFGKTYFTVDDFARAIGTRYGAAKSRIIANSVFDLVDPNMSCVKRRGGENVNKTFYSLTNGNFKEFLKRSINKSTLIKKISSVSEDSYSGFMNISNDDMSNVALKLLSIFDYITYEILGGEEPEIFIRLNDPNKIKSIILRKTYYSNGYVTKAKQKHDRDVKVLLRFFNSTMTDSERWDYIEDYFLGYDVLCNNNTETESTVPMIKAIDKAKSYPLNQVKSWDKIREFFDENDNVIIDKIAKTGVPIPEYLITLLKKTSLGDDIMMSWPSKDTLICQQDTTEDSMKSFENKGWHAYRIHEINYDKLKEVLK